MKRYLYLIIAIFVFSVSLSSIKAESCRSITDKDKCKSPCEWVDKATVTDESTGKTKTEGVCKKPFPEASSCTDFSNETDCTIGRTSDGKKFGCAWNAEYEFCSVTGLVYLSCGTGNEKAYDIPKILPKLTSYLILVLKTITPTILIVIGMLQILKAVAAQDEDGMKKAKSSLIKKLIISVLIFTSISIVQFVIKQVADNSKDEQASIQDCLNCFVNSDCGKSMYYTDGYGNCKSLKSHDNVDCPVKDY